MRAVDTNVLVRLLTRDEPEQCRAAARFFEECRRVGEDVFVSNIVLCELAWVLKRSYALPKDVLLMAIREVLDLEGFAVEAAPEVHAAVEQWSQGQGDFPDYLIREIAVSAGCRDVVTFDLALYKDAGFSILR